MGRIKSSFIYYFLEIAKEDKGILYLIHNHPKSNPPLPSSDDLAYFTSLEINMV